MADVFTFNSYETIRFVSNKTFQQHFPDICALKKQVVQKRCCGKSYTRIEPDFEKIYRTITNLPPERLQELKTLLNAKTIILPRYGSFEGKIL